MRWFLVLGICVALCNVTDAQVWNRHTIDASSRGADGVRMADVNGDSLPDVVTGWEEGGLVRVCLHPGVEQCKQEWPSVTVGQVRSPEDAVLVDLDGDGNLDVVSCCEGNTQSVFVHWAPTSKSDFLNSESWQTVAFPATEKLSQWMFCVPADVDGKNGVDLIIGSKNKSGQVGWLASPENPRELGTWKYHHLVDAGWIMSLRMIDVNRDGTQDLLVSDRKAGQGHGIYWIDFTESTDGKPTRNFIGGSGHELMFLDAMITERETYVAAATRNQKILLFKQPADHLASSWQVREIPNPNELQNGKAIRFGDIDGNGTTDIVHTANCGKTGKPGIAVLFCDEDFLVTSQVDVLDVGIKFDRIELMDVDQDGDLDIMTCEEQKNLGVFWLENPR